jgi:crossover junction endodeoxyribonuclease RuvC
LIILGIDPGSRVTGFGVIDCTGNRYCMLDSGAIRLEKQGEIANRLVHLHDQIESILENHQPDVLSIEKVFHGVNFQSALLLGQVRGVIMMQAARRGLQVHEYSATQVKKTVTSYGRAEKGQVQEMVRLLLNLRETPKPNDVADALALAICHAHMGTWR